MSNVTVIGALGQDPELRFSPSGTPMTTLSVCENRKRGETTEPHWYDVGVVGKMAENVCESLRQGDRVIVVGQLEQQKWTTQGGDPRSKVAIHAWQVGPSLEYAVVEGLTKNEREGGG